MIGLKRATQQDGQATVLKNSILSVHKPGRYCLLGRNGAGKNDSDKSG